MTQSVPHTLCKQPIVIKSNPNTNHWEATNHPCATSPNLSRLTTEPLHHFTAWPLDRWPMGRKYSYRENISKIYSDLPLATEPLLTTESITAPLTTWSLDHWTPGRGNICLWYFCITVSSHHLSTATLDLLTTSPLWRKYLMIFLPDILMIYSSTPVTEPPD